MNPAAFLKRHKGMQLVLRNSKQPTGEYIVSCEAIIVNDRGDQIVSIGKLGCFDGELFTEQLLENMLGELDVKACDFEREAKEIEEKILEKAKKP